MQPTMNIEQKKMMDCLLSSLGQAFGNMSNQSGRHQHDRLRSLTPAPSYMTGSNPTPWQQQTEADAIMDMIYPHQASSTVPSQYRHQPQIFSFDMGPLMQNFPGLTPPSFPGSGSMSKPIDEKSTSRATESTTTTTSASAASAASEARASKKLRRSSQSCKSKSGKSSRMYNRPTGSIAGLSRPMLRAKRRIPTTNQVKINTKRPLLTTLENKQQEQDEEEENDDYSNGYYDQYLQTVKENSENSSNDRNYRPPSPHRQTYPSSSIYYHTQSSLPSSMSIPMSNLPRMSNLPTLTKSVYDNSSYSQFGDNKTESLPSSLSGQQTFNINVYKNHHKSTYTIVAFLPGVSDKNVTTSMIQTDEENYIVTISATTGNFNENRINSVINPYGSVVSQEYSLNTNMVRQVNLMMKRKIEDGITASFNDGLLIIEIRYSPPVFYTNISIPISTTPAVVSSSSSSSSLPTLSPAAIPADINTIPTATRQQMNGITTSGGSSMPGQFYGRWNNNMQNPMMTFSSQTGGNNNNNNSSSNNNSSNIVTNEESKKPINE